MKKEDIVNAMQDIDEKLVEQADMARRGKNVKRSRRKIAFFSVGAAAAVVCGAFVISNLTGGFSKLISSPYAVAMAAYPEQSNYPNDLAVNRDDKMDKWRSDREVRYNAAQSIPDKTDDFFAQTTKTFLSDTDEKNSVYSPVNLYMALAVLAQSTNGDTLSQILEVMGADSRKQAAEIAENIWNAVYIDDGVAKTVLANSLWLNEGVEVKEETARQIADAFKASIFKGNMQSSDYANALSAWIKEQTGGLINEKVEFSDDELLEIVSTLYYKANWNDEFHKSSNEERAFHAPDGDVTATFMYEYDGCGTYYYGNTFGAVKKSLDHGGTMTFILPDEDKSVDDVLADEDFAALVFGSDFNSGIMGYKKYKNMITRVHVPKFDIMSEMDLAAGLRSLGMTDVFEDGDFSALVSYDYPLMITEVKHTVRVSMDEQGVTAAAVIRMPLAGAGEPPEEEIELYFDRPFIFVITSEQGVPLFVGTIYNLG